MGSASAQTPSEPLSQARQLLEQRNPAHIGSIVLVKIDYIGCRWRRAL